MRGESITAYATRHKLSIPDRIDLFVQACEGVQHAHQKGIIHRDLKPSNILVTLQNDRPVPKIIDFGVAKAMTHSLTEHTLHTEFGALIGTPEYMSPEQAEMSGLDIDTRTEVYALGVVLYELLTGMLPFEAKSLREKGLDEIRRTIREVDPPKPSTKITTSADSVGRSTSSAEAGRLASQLRGDLDWIAMKALEKDRTRRYATVGELAADLQRHLDNLPVLASPPSSVYRVRKFVRRNRLAVAAAATLVSLLVAFAATMAIQARRIANERDRTNAEAQRANREAEAAKQVSNFLVGLFNVSDPSEARGDTLTAREVLDKGAREIEQTLKAQPEVQARLQATIGNVYTSLGLYRAAEPLFQLALSTHRRTLGADAETLATMNALANLYWYQGRYQEAEPLYLSVVEGRRRRLGEDHPETLRAKYDLASLYGKQERWDEAERLQLNTLATQRRVLGEEHPDTLDSINNIASFYYQRHRYAEAQPLYITALNVSRKVLGNDHPATLTSIHNLATNYEALGQNKEAEARYLEALERRRRVLGDAHPNTTNTEMRLGLFYESQQRYSEAETLFLAAYRVDSVTFGAEHSRTRRDITRLTDLYVAWGKPDKAAGWRAKLPKEPSPKP